MEQTSARVWVGFRVYEGYSSCYRHALLLPIHKCGPGTLAKAEKMH